MPARGETLRSRKSGPTIGLALGSGSARGLAHIGVIRAIEEAGIRIDMVAGCSIGALIGAAYVSGRLDALERQFRGINWKGIGSLLDPIFPWSGFIDGRKILDFVRPHVSPKEIEQLPLPFCAVATDLISGREIVIRDGNLVDAVRASISVPGIFAPVRRDRQILVDGGLVNPVPVSSVRALGADLVIAVDLNYNIVAGKRRPRRNSAPKNAGPASPEKGRYSLEKMSESLRSSRSPTVGRILAWLEKERLPGMVDVLLGSLYIMQAQITEIRLLIEQPDILIRPPLGSVRLIEFDRAGEMIAAGHRAALGPIRDLEQRLTSPGRKL